MIDYHYIMEIYSNFHLIIFLLIYIFINIYFLKIYGQIISWLNILFLSMPFKLSFSAVFILKLLISELGNSIIFFDFFLFFTVFL